VRSRVSASSASKARARPPTTAAPILLAERRVRIPKPAPSTTPGSSRSASSISTGAIFCRRG
jgi:hypothetical protein